MESKESRTRNFTLSMIPPMEKNHVQETNKVEKKVYTVMLTCTQENVIRLGGNFWGALYSKSRLFHGQKEGDCQSFTAIALAF